MEIKATLIAETIEGSMINDFMGYLHEGKDFPDQIPHLSNCVSYPFPGPNVKLNENEYIDIQYFNLTNLNL